MTANCRYSPYYRKGIHISASKTSENQIGYRKQKAFSKEEKPPWFPYEMKIQQLLHRI